MNRRNNYFLYLTVILITVVLLSLLSIYASSEAEKALRVSAKSATLYEPETKNFLYEKNADERLPMASTTKIMTALLALENSKPDEIVKIDELAVGVEGSSAYLKAGEKLTMEELTYALLLQSANDAAVAIAYHIGGSIEAFADMMNERAASLGLVDTHFTNPHGLDDKEHYTTARELALIAAEALKNPDFKKISSTYKKSFITEERSRTYVNHNKLLKLYDGSIGMKTGFTKKSGRCLVGAAERDGLTFITVTLDAPDDWRDHREMLDLGYSTLEKITFAEPHEISYDVNILDGSKTSVRVENLDGASIIVPRGEHTVEEFTKLPRYVIAPVHEGDILGEVMFTLDGEKVASVKLVALDNVEKSREDGFIKRLFEKIFN